MARTKSIVLRTVHDLLAAEGLTSVTFNRVSRESGVSRTTLYRHWAGPSELIAAAWSEVAPSSEVPHTPDLERDLVEGFRQVRDVVDSPPMRRSLPALLVAGERHATIATLHADFVRSRRHPILLRLRAAVDEGRLPPEADLELMVDLLSGPLFYRRLLRREHTSDRQLRLIVSAALGMATATA